MAAMNDAGTPSIHASACSYVAIVVAFVWIGVAMWARWVVDSAEFAGDVFPWPHILTAVFLIAGAWAVSAATLVSARAARGGPACAALVFALIVGASLVEDGVAPWDAAAMFAALLGVRAAADGRRLWSVVFIGAAGGCTPLALAGVLCPVHVSRDRGGVVFSAVGTLAGAAAAALLFQALFGRLPRDAMLVPHEIVSLGPQNIWREWATRLDLAAPVCVLALLAVLRMWFDREGAAEANRLDRIASASALWLIVKGLGAVMQPGIFVAHTLVFLLPAFSLVGLGWGVMRDLPLRRSDWSLSLFTVACYSLLAALAWTPLRKTGELILIALYL